MSDMVTIPVTALNKMVGFVETTKGVFDKQAADAGIIKAAAEKVATKLVEGGFVTAEKKANFISNLVANPAKAFELVEKLAADVVGTRTKVATLEKSAAEAVPVMGQADTVKAASANTRKESDLAWEQGFRI